MDSVNEKVRKACLQTTTLQNHLHARDVANVLAAAIQAVDPYQAVKNCLRRDQNWLSIGHISYDLNAIRRLKVIGAGKAARPMLQAVVDILGDRLAGGCMIAKYAEYEVAQPGDIPILEGNHPVPGEKSIAATQKLISTLQNNHPDDIILCLISGGGSALMTSPQQGISLADMQSLTATLLACGATINEINILRKHLDVVKGGGLTRLAFPAQLACLVLSDVVGNPLDVIASGPTFPDPSTFNDCWQIVNRYRIEDQLPTNIQATLLAGLAGQIAETLKPGDPLFNRTQNILVGSNYQAAQAGLAQAQMSGGHTLLLTTYLQGEARNAGQLLASIARQIDASGEPLPRPACIAVGGETTVTLRGQGRGGRNQELALGAVDELAGLPNCLLATFATDGEDGPTDAAGALVTGETLGRAQQLGLDPASFLWANNSYAFFQSMGDLLITGPTGTNVNDLAFLCLF